jgi:RimJ/RimL family protein N-acetyltransferase
LPDGWRFGPLSLDEVLALQDRGDELTAYAKRFKGRAFCDAWGIWIDDDLAHVSWMIPHEHDRLLAVRNLKLRPGEAEITHAITPVGFRGRGLFPTMIKQLMEVARERGYATVWAIAGESNNASQRAITKAGFVRHGDIYRWIFSYLPGEPYLTWRGHRLRSSPGG